MPIEFTQNAAGGLFAAAPVDPVSLSGANHADVGLKGKRYVEVQFDPLTNSAYRLYFRLDESAAATSAATIADFKPQGYLAPGGCQSFWIDPDASETPTLHVLVTDGSGSVSAGGTDDRLLILALRTSAD